MAENFENKMTKALQKKALGYSLDEVTEEYTTLDGEMQLSKRKVTTKYVAPDIAAYKALQEASQTEKAVTNMSDEEIEEEKRRLLKLLNE